MGLAIGATVMALIMSPWGKQSGGHINPAMTFTFYSLGKIARWDALFYGIAQFSGATSGVVLATFLLRGAPGDGAVRYAVTAPGVHGAAVAFAAELAISFILMITVLLVTNHERFPIRRVVGPADVAALAAHLMTNTAVTGATYDIDGGQQLVEG